MIKIEKKSEKIIVIKQIIKLNLSEMDNPIEFIIK
jgi:hypothetical protein